MTRKALNKIVFCIGAFLVIACLCVAVDALIPTSSDASTKRSAIYSLIEDENCSAEEVANELAQERFGVSVDHTIEQSFVTELMEPAEFESASSSGSVVSYLFDGKSEQAHKKCEQLLNQKGWHRVKNNQENDDSIESYVKAEGTYRWIVVQYLRIDSKTSVLINTFRANEVE